MKRSSIGMLAALFCCLTAVAQQPGDLDTTFSGDGKLTIPGFDPAVAVVVQPDGKTLVATSTTDSTGKVFAILRLNYDGSMDQTFGVGGVALTDVGPGDDEPRDMVLQADGKFIVTNKHGWCLVRFLPNGQVDNNWAVGGVMRIEFAGWNLNASSVAGDGNGGLWVAGSMDSLGIGATWPVLMRLNFYGAPDPSFNADGVYVFPPNGYSTILRKQVAVYPSGRILLTSDIAAPTPPGWSAMAESRNPDLSDCVPVNFRAPGAATHHKQVAINTNGIATGLTTGGCWFGFGNTYIKTTADIQYEGYCFQWSSWPMPVGTSSLTDIVADAAGHFVLVGHQDLGNQSQWRVGRTKVDNVWLDSLFGSYGFVNTDFSPGESAEPLCVSMAHDGCVTVAGRAMVNGVEHIALARYHNLPDPRARLSAKVFLGGPYNALDQRMSDGLRADGLLPQQQPYAAFGDSAVSNPDALFAWPGTMDITGDSAVVDWIWLELLSTADSTTVLGARAALVLRNGAVVDRDGRSPVDMNCGAGSYFLRIQHRSHLSVTCSDPLQLSDSPTSVDLTSPATNTFGTDAQKEMNGVCMLWPGDVTGNGALKYAGMGNDRDPILLAIGGGNLLGTIGGYHREDINLDGVVKYTGIDNDRDIILQSIGGNNVLAVRYEQLP